MLRKLKVRFYQILSSAGLLLGAIGVYLLLRSIVRPLVAVWGGSEVEPWVTLCATLLATSLFWLLHPYAQRYAEWLLYRNHEIPRDFLDQMTQQLASAIQLEQLAQLVSGSIAGQLGAAWGSLLIPDERGKGMCKVEDGAVMLSLNTQAEAWLAHEGLPLLRSQPQAWVTAEMLALMQQQQIELAVLLFVGEHVVGVLVFGPRQDGRAYTDRTLFAVRVLARQAALAVQNALLVRQQVRQMESYQRRLEDEVQRRTEVMLSDRNRLNAILQNMADALLVTAADGRILLANPVFERIVRRSVRTLLGRSFTHILDMPQLWVAICDTLESPGRAHVAEIVLSDTDVAGEPGKQRIYRAMVTALGDRSAVVALLRDVTADVELDRMKSEFIATVSHELRTPLTSILGFAKLSRRTFTREIGPALSEVLPSLASPSLAQAVSRVEKNLDIMVSEGERLTNLINDVLDIAALDAGTMQWNDQLCVISALVRQVVQRLHPHAEAKGLKLVVELTEVIAMIWADPVRIAQVLGNLITNAIKFTAQGSVRVTVAPLAAGVTVGGGMVLGERVEWQAPETGGVLIAVSDTGPGITPQQQLSLFRRFHQGGNLDNKPQGTGLGLALCYALLQHYRGAIWFESQAGQGSTFYVALSLAPQEAILSLSGAGEQ